MDDSAQEIAGRYLIESTLGEGGAASVFRVRDRLTGKRVALKRLSLSDNRHRERLLGLFEREYHTLAQLAHPAVIRVFDYGVDETGPHYTMEILDGQDLRALAPVPYRDACAFAYDIASALSLLHSRKLVHRDVTSRNVIVTAGRAKLIDFGALLPMGSSEDIVGTPLYMAPEVVLMQAIDGRTDLYSLGVVLYHALTGRRSRRRSSTRTLRPSADRTRPGKVRRDAVITWSPSGLRSVARARRSGWRRSATRAPRAHRLPSSISPPPSGSTSSRRVQ